MSNNGCEFALALLAASVSQLGHGMNRRVLDRTVERTQDRTHAMK